MTIPRWLTLCALGFLLSVLLALSLLHHAPTPRPPTTQGRTLTVSAK